MYIINTSDHAEERFGINNIKMDIQIEELTTSKNQVEYLQKIWKTWKVTTKILTHKKGVYRTKIDHKINILVLFWWNLLGKYLKTVVTWKISPETWWYWREKSKKCWNCRENDPLLKTDDIVEKIMNYRIILIQKS